MSFAKIGFATLLCAGFLVVSSCGLIPGLWSSEAKTDAVTGESLVTATTVEVSGSVVAQLVVNCTTANSKGENPLFQMSVTFVDAVGSALAPTGLTASKLDDQDPQLMLPLSFVNQLVVLSGINDRESALAMRSATKLGISGNFPNGRASFVFGLDNKDFQSAVIQCSRIYVDPVAVAADETSSSNPTQSNKLETDTANAGGPSSERFEIVSAEFEQWLGELRDSGKVAKADSALRSSGVITERFYEGDYGASYFAVRRNTVFADSDIAVILLAEDKPNTMGCCSQPQITLFMSGGGSGAKLSEFASKTGCALRDIALSERNGLVNNYGFSNAVGSDLSRVALAFECERKNLR